MLTITGNRYHVLYKARSIMQNNIIRCTGKFLARLRFRLSTIYVPCCINESCSSLYADVCNGSFLRGHVTDFLGVIYKYISYDVMRFIICYFVSGK